MSIVRSSVSLPNADKEATAEKSRRLAVEADMIADAQASVAAGRIVSLEAVTAWVDSWDTAGELPSQRSDR
jgi:predicted transcriptional regulator